MSLCVGNTHSRPTLQAGGPRPAFTSLRAVSGCTRISAAASIPGSPNARPWEDSALSDSRSEICTPMDTDGQEIAAIGSQICVQTPRSTLEFVRLQRGRRHQQAKQSPTPDVADPGARSVTNGGIR